MDLSDATVLIADDDVSLLEVFERYLHGAEEVRQAEGGEEALDLVDDTVDIILLDRRMPGVSGDEVLDRIRDRGFTCPVVMVTAVVPDEAITSLRFNEYVTKPVSQDELRQVVQHTLQLSDRDVLVQEYFALMDTLLALENELDLGGLYENGEYQDVLSHVEELREQLDTTQIGELETEISQRLVDKWPRAETDPWLTSP